jgi:hypothetical protein
MALRVNFPLYLLLTLLAMPTIAADPAAQWRAAWPDTDFSRTTVDLGEIRSGGPGKDGIPAIDAPRSVLITDYAGSGEEPVVGLVVEDEARAYPLRILIWHEIVNDRIGDVPVAVTYCPLCNTSVVFDRRLDGRVLDFGTTGNLHHSDLVMYDRQTRSWWQQYGGDAIVGELAGERLRAIPSRLESLAEFRARAPGGSVLVPDPGARLRCQSLRGLRPLRGAFSLRWAAPPGCRIHDAGGGGGRSCLDPAIIERRGHSGTGGS